MSDRRITKLSIENLELLFTPPGLPIIDKGGASPTTSIAILGDAGAGKTTLAVSLAQAIAADAGGLALYLTTELAPTEIKYKVSLLGVPATVVAWRHRAMARAGDIIGQHLALLDDTDETSSPVRRRALEAAWQLVDTTANEPPIRCVVIDAFPLPELSNGSGRDDVVTLIQALEGRGVSVVIIQEAAGVTGFVPFVTDVVFQLKFDEDPDTGERVRKLGCPKSRYARSQVGPHDTGIDNDRVMVWPDPLPVATGKHVTMPQRVPAAPVFLPIDVPNHDVLFDHGGLVMSTLESGSWLPRLLKQTAGIHLAWVRCGPMIHVETENANVSAIVSVLDSEGAYALAWSVLRLQESFGVNTVVFQNLAALHRRRRFRTAIEHVLEAFRLRGLLVCVHGFEKEVAELSALADFESDGRWLGAREMVGQRHRPAAAWLAVREWPCALEAVSPVGRQDVENVRRTFSDALQKLDAGAGADDVRHDLDKVGLSTNESAARVAILRMNVLLHLLGYEGLARDRAEALPQDETIGAVAWANAIMGRDWEAARAITIALARAEELTDDVQLLWAGLTAVHANSEPALLVARDGLKRFPALLDLVVRALARSSRWDEVDAAIALVAKPGDSGRYLTDWIRADARLDGPGPADWEEAERRLATLIASDVPAIHRAAMLHGRGVAASRLGRDDEARRWWQLALEHNPHLEISSKLLAAHEPK